MVRRRNSRRLKNYHGVVPSSHTVVLPPPALGVNVSKSSCVPEDVGPNSTGMCSSGPVRCPPDTYSAPWSRLCSLIQLSAVIMVCIIHPKKQRAGSTWGGAALRLRHQCRAVNVISCFASQLLDLGQVNPGILDKVALVAQYF
jgi:hypothetical protein